MLAELEHLGPRLRAARTARGWTLDELATRAGMSVSTLSRLESGKRQATLELLLPLTRLLGVSVESLLSTAAPDPRVRRPTVERDGQAIRPLTPEGSRAGVFEIVFRPVTELPALRVHDGYEWLYVVAGRLRLRVGEQDLVLGKGEAAEFDTTIPHALSAVGSSPARVISIFDASGERLHVRGLDGG